MVNFSCWLATTTKKRKNLFRFATFIGLRFNTLQSAMTNSGERHGSGKEGGLGHSHLAFTN
jgi:hypothetical protein